MSRRKRKRTRAKRGAPSPRTAGAMLIRAAVVVMVLGAATGGWLATRYATTPQPAPPRAARPDTPVATPRAQATATAVPRAEAPVAVPSPEAASPVPSPVAPSGPRVALVFDDAGGSLDDLTAIIDIGRTVTVAVLPALAYSTAVSERARAAGLEVILHIPIASTDSERRLGPGAVTTDMDDAAIEATVHKGFLSVPGAIGANNHMGSAGTADRRVMRAVMRAVKARGGFFLDSRTTAGTVVEEVAAEVGVKTARRAIFLDNDENEAAIRLQVQRMIEMAKTRGSIVAIGHAQKVTPKVIALMLPEFDRQGVHLVPLSTLVSGTRAKNAGSSP